MSAIQSGALAPKFDRSAEHWRPRGVERRTASDAEVLIFEPAEVVNTGDAPVSEFTAKNGIDI